jgi:hypothetical protein
MAWNQVQPHPEALAALDPYLEWAMQTNFAYYAYRDGGRVDWVPVILELQGITAQQFAAGEWRPPSNSQSWLWIPPVYGRPPAGLARSKFCTASVRLEFFRQLAERGSPLSKVVRRVALSLLTPSTPPEPYAPKNSPGGIAKPGLVVTGIIDDGLAFANQRFRRALGTRIEYLWNQDGPPGGVPGVLFGREIVKHDVGGVPGIDTLMATAKHGGALVAEEEVYRTSGHIDYTVSGHKPVAQRGAHGTHVMDIACGEDSSSDPDNRPIIAVQLPVATTADSSGALLTAPVLEGLRYIVDRADQLAVREACGPLPIVVNLSYGFIAGPHDGNSILEAAIDELITLRRTVAPMSVVLPAGNSHLARCHARFTLAHNAQQQPRLHWRIQPDDRTPSYMELWLPQLSAGHARVAVRVNPPGAANTSPWIKEGEVWEWRPQNDVLCKVIYFNGVAAGHPRNMVFIAVASTATLHPTDELAPAGRWELQVKNVGHAATFDAWIQRDDTPYGYPVRGRQSRFDDRHYNYRHPITGRKLESDTSASYVKRAGTINAMATGRETVVIGGFHRKEWSAAPYSAAGPIIKPPGTLWPHRMGPEAMSVSEDSVVHHGLLAAGTQSNSTVAMTGTSVAAPQIARWTAERMANGQPYDRQAVFQFAKTGVAPGYRTEANPPPGAPPQPPINRSGGGRIEAPPIVDRKIER